MYDGDQWRKQKIFMGGDFIQWLMVVVCIWCALFFVTLQFEVIHFFKPTFWRSLLT